MRSTSLIGRWIFSALLFFPALSGAAVVVVPAAPLSNQNVQVDIVNQYLGVYSGSVAASTITRVGNVFTIDLLLDLVCPGVPPGMVGTVTASFNLGALSAGTYQVVANISHRSHFPSCGSPPMTQSTSFAVGDPIGIPAGNDLLYLLAACLMALAAARRLRSPVQRHR
jgi:hypothetical protein